jgi:hypothetical protein
MPLDLELVRNGSAGEQEDLQRSVAARNQEDLKPPPQWVLFLVVVGSIAFFGVVIMMFARDGF